MRYTYKLSLMAAALSAAVFLSACGGHKEGVQGSSADISTSEEISEAAAVTAAPELSETYPGTVAATDGTGAFSSDFGIMHATVLGIQPDKETGINIYNLQDKTDTENTWSIPANQIGSIEAEMTPGGEVAVAFSGDMINDYENVQFIAVIPEGNYLISSVTGTTLVNVMSTFSVKTDNGEEMTFLKDNCKIEEGAMTGDSGERISVYYAQSADGTNYPLAVYKAE